MTLSLLKSNPPYCSSILDLFTRVISPDVFLIKVLHPEKRNVFVFYHTERYYVMFNILKFILLFRQVLHMHFKGNNSIHKGK